MSSTPIRRVGTDRELHLLQRGFALFPVFVGIVSGLAGKLRDPGREGLAQLARTGAVAKLLFLRPHGLQQRRGIARVSLHDLPDEGEVAVVGIERVSALADVARQGELGPRRPVGGQQVGIGLEPLPERIVEGFAPEVYDKMIVSQCSGAPFVLTILPPPRGRGQG